MDTMAGRNSVHDISMFANLRFLPTALDSIFKSRNFEKRFQFFHHFSVDGQ